jgi:hypothetical protein
MLAKVPQKHPKRNKYNAKIERSMYRMNQLFLGNGIDIFGGHIGKGVCKSLLLPLQARNMPEEACWGEDERAKLKERRKENGRRGKMVGGGVVCGWGIQGRKGEGEGGLLLFLLSPVRFSLQLELHVSLCGPRRIRCH